MYKAMKAYQIAYKITSELKKRHDLLVEQQRVLLTEISQAEATENKAREVMLRAVQINDLNSK